MSKQAELTQAMIAYEADCPARVHHFLKVLAFAQTLAELEDIQPETAAVLSAAAIVHDIGIRPSLEKYGSAAGPHQEAEGPPLARAMLTSLGYAPAVIERVCYLVGHHHSYDAIDGIDYQILVEADFLVNIHEGAYTREATQAALDNVFRTQSGKALLQTLYLR